MYEECESLFEQAFGLIKLEEQAFNDAEDDLMHFFCEVRLELFSDLCKASHLYDQSKFERQLKKLQLQHQAVYVRMVALKEELAKTLLQRKQQVKYSEKTSRYGLAGPYSMALFRV